MTVNITKREACWAPSSTYHTIYEEFLPKYLISICLSCYINLPIYRLNTGTGKHVKWHHGDATNQILTVGNSTTHNQLCQQIKMEYFWSVLGRSVWLAWVFWICWFRLKQGTRRNLGTSEAGRAQTARPEAEEQEQSHGVFTEPVLRVVCFGDDRDFHPRRCQSVKPLWGSVLKAVERQVIWGACRHSGPNTSLSNQSAGHAAQPPVL